MLTFTATHRKGAHSLVGEDPLDKMGGTSLPSQIENSSEDMQEVRDEIDEERSDGLKTLRNAGEKIPQEALIMYKMHLKPHTLPLRY